MHTRGWRPVVQTTVGGARRVTAVLLTVAMAVVVALAVQRTADSVSALRTPELRTALQLESDRFACLETLLHERIPAGATVYEDDPGSVASQRIPEMLTPHYRPVRAPVPGAYVVHFAQPGPCNGLGVAVRRLDLP